MNNRGRPVSLPTIPTSVGFIIAWQLANANQLLKLCLYRFWFCPMTMEEEVIRCSPPTNMNVAKKATTSLQTLNKNIPTPTVSTKFALDTFLLCKTLGDSGPVECKEETGELSELTNTISKYCCALGAEWQGLKKPLFPSSDKGQTKYLSVPSPVHTIFTLQI